MKLTRHREDEDLVNMTPLIDVVFILLIFFMLAGTVEKPSPMDVDPPSSTIEEEGEELELVVLIDADGRVAFQDRIFANDTALIEQIGVYLSLLPGAEVQLKADASVEALRVIAVMEALRAAGVRSLVLLTVGRKEDGA